MRARCLLAATLCLALAGCGAKPAGNAAAGPAGRAPDAAQVIAGRWQQLWQNPEKAIGIANALGYRNGAFAAAGKGFESTGPAQPVSDRHAERAKNTTTFTARGGAASRLDSLAFTLHLTDPADANRAANGFRHLVTGFLGRYEIGFEDDVKRAMKAETALTAAYPGCTVEVAKAPIPGAGDPAAHRLTVTITRTGATAPANSKTQGN